MRLGEVVEQYLADLRTRARPRTVDAAASELRRIVEDLAVARVGEIRKPSVMLWRQRRVSEGAANKTVNNQLGYLKAALNLCVRLEQLPANPLNGIRKLPTGAHHQRRRPRALSEWEISRLLAAALEIDGECRGFPREPLIRTLILTGARWGELTQATWADLDVEHAHLTLRAETTKTGQARVIPLRAELLERLLALAGDHLRLLGRAPTPSSRLFLAPRGAPWCANTGRFLRHLRECYARAGILERVETPRTGSRGPAPKGRVASTDAQGMSLGIHTLRHTFATRLARAGVPPATAQRLTGHKSERVLLQIYTHVTTDDARKALDDLPVITSDGTSERAETGGVSRPPKSASL
jgi:integrase